ncbi:DUF2254 domain-containing protein [Paracoccus shanxieyensis]|uniref:DUF2254 domain-containing protein n=1 Tax=Paracoccus shanxieyensis TaxID=2675752 RepID=A0A6L6IW78_9RHOB|nr:DUF2254 domain-containing protein [Paracoccus shanxieyensis]MTH64755.1 DUF2254 domain-containing protein [Paracoccus shanxieyensis]MTH88012.1 DUF2254 domain-containing protein [Paracoccus shanxieyensis]
MTKWRWILSRLTRRVWLRTSLIGLIGILTAILAAVVERYIPWSLPGRIGADAVGGLLNIIASSMLAVTTFSLSVMTSAYGSATNNVTPRATKLLIEDRVTQNALSTFIGSFLFAVVGLIVLATGSYGERGRTVLFCFTIGIIGLIVISLLRWIDHLTRLGRVGETTGRVEDAARNAIKARIAEPFLGCSPLRGDLPHHHEVVSEQVGYLQHIDTAALQGFAEDQDIQISVPVLPGSFIYDGTVLARLSRGVKDADKIRACFTIGDERSFDQDPRFGMVVMTEIASRALSSATNDPGTALDVIGRSTRLLTIWAKRDQHQPKPRHPRIFVTPLRDADMLEDAFMLIARDGAGLIEVQLRLQKSLAALGRLGNADFRKAVADQAALAAARAQEALPMQIERDQLSRLRQSPPAP